MNIAFIAAGGRGGAHVSEAKKMPELVDVIAMCDVNSKNLEYAAELLADLVYDEPLRERIIGGQRARLDAFQPDRIEAEIDAALAPVGV